MFPDWLYVSIRSEEDSHTTRMTSQLDAIAFIQQQPDYWIEQASTKQKKKKIVFADWTFRGYHSDKWRLSELKNIFQTLIQHGFEVWLWQVEDGVLLNKKDISYLDDYGMIIPVSPEEIKSQMAKKGHAAHEVLVLQYFEVRKLIADMLGTISKEEVGCIDTSQFYRETPSRELLSRACSILKKSKIKPTALESREVEINFSRDKYSLQSSQVWFEQFPEIEVNRIKNLKVYNDKGDLSQYFAHPEWFVTLTSACFHSDFHLDWRILLINALNLKKLSWREMLPDDFNLFRRFSKLEELGISFSDINAPFLDWVLKHQNLKIVSFAKCNNLMNVMRDFELGIYSPLVNMESLSISHSEIECRSLHGLLQLTPHLKQLSLNWCVNISEINSEGWRNLINNVKDLRQLNLSDNRLPMKSMAEIINTAVHLENLTFRFGHFTGNAQKDFTLFEQHCNLRKLDLSFSNISKEQLLVILKHMKGLNEVALEGCEALIDIEADPQFVPYLDILKYIPKNAIGNLIDNEGFLHGALTSAKSYFGSIFSSSTSAQKVDSLHVWQTRSESSCDADTMPSESPKEFNLSRIFYSKKGWFHPHLSCYRKEVYDKLKVKTDVLSENELPFLLGKKQQKLEACDQPLWFSSLVALKETWKNDTSNNTHYGVVDLEITRKWQSLPSLSPHETMSHLFVEGLKQNNIVIKYCKDDNLYYIRFRSKYGKVCTVHYLFDVPLSPVLPKALKELVESYKAKFKAKALKIDKNKKMTGREYMDALRAQKVGACRHRAVVFMEEMSEHYSDVPVRYVGNSCHAYVEVCWQGQWMTCDLGGYPAKINIAEPHHPDIKQVAANNPTLQPDVVMNDAPESEMIMTPSDKLLNRDLMEDIPEAEIVVPPSEALLNQDFVTWDRDPEACILGQFTEDIVRRTAQKILIEMASSEVISAYHLYLQAACKAIGRPVYYINSPRDLVCSSNWIEQGENNVGYLKPGPGGRLHRFLKKHQDESPVIIVNYDHFKADDIVMLNSIIDNPSVADGTPTPSKALILGLYPPGKPDAYKGSDFNSRFNKKIAVAFTEDDVNSLAISLLERVVDEPIQDAYSIDLFESTNWHKTLLGGWILQGDQFYYKEGKLEKALRSGRPIAIKNGPWHIESFKRFWEETFLHEKFTVNEKEIEIPFSAGFSKASGYSWDKLAQRIQWESEALSESQPCFILNPNQLGLFERTYECRDSKLYAESGWLKAHRGQTLNLEMTRNISASQWAQLLTKCEKYDVTIKLHPQSWHDIPDEIKPQIASSDHIPLPSDMAQVIMTEDMDLTVEKLLEKTDAQVFDISECSSTDILSRLNPTWLEDNIRFKFDAIFSDVWQALQEGETVILKGDFTEEMIDNLAPLSVAGAKLPPPLEKSKTFGRLILVSDNNDFYHLPHSKDIVDAVVKRAYLVKQYGEAFIAEMESKINIETTSFSKLKTIFEYIKLHPNEDDFHEPWNGLTHLLQEQQYRSFEMDLSLEACEIFERARLEQVIIKLKAGPYVFIAGETGTGKSTFVHEILAKHPNYKVYEGDSKFEKWLKKGKPGKEKIFFIDEANIGSNHFSMFEGLYNRPPTILYKGKIYDLTPEHKVVFAGNPLSYGGSRHLPSLFERHGQSVVFGPMIPAYIHHRILSPIFEGTALSKPEIETLDGIFLNVYEKICDLNPDTVLISARELQMMALQVATSDDLISDREKAVKSVYHIAKNVLPDSHLHMFNSWFEEAFETPISYESSVTSIGNFVMTSSRWEPYHNLKDLLKIREFQQQNALNNDQRYGGLNGLIFEGDPGEGKSRFAVEMLLAKGYHQGTLTEKCIDDKVFYLLPASMPVQVKMAYLLKAFNEGAIVIMDEFNSCPMMEQLLNALLMGRDLNGNRPTRPGFKLIGTQNPISMEGRLATPLALERRMLKCNFETYKKGEMISILESTSVKPADAAVLVQDYLVACAYAEAHDKSPKPVFRDLLRVAEEFRKSAYPDFTPAKDMLASYVRFAPVGKKRKYDAEKEGGHLSPDEKKFKTVGIASEPVPPLRSSYICNWFSHVKKLPENVLDFAADKIATGIIKTERYFSTGYDPG